MSHELGGLQEAREESEVGRAAGFLGFGIWGSGPAVSLGVASCLSSTVYPPWPDLVA